MNFINVSLFFFFALFHLHSSPLSYLVTWWLHFFSSVTLWRRVTVNMATGVKAVWTVPLCGKLEFCHVSAECLNECVWTTSGCVNSDFQELVLGINLSAFVIPTVTWHRPPGTAASFVKNRRKFRFMACSHCYQFLRTHSLQWRYLPVTGNSLTAHFGSALTWSPFSSEATDQSLSCCIRVKVKLSLVFN